MCWSTLRVVIVFLKTNLCIHCCVHWHVSSMAAITMHWTITLVAPVPPSPLKLSTLSIQSVLISEDLYSLGKWLSNYSTEEVSQHMCGFELWKFFIWLRRRENVSWKPETSALVLKIFDEQIGTHSLLLEHTLHNSFQWQLLYTLEKNTAFPNQNHEWKKSKWRRRICKIVVRLYKVKNWPHSSEVPPWFYIVIAGAWIPDMFFF